MLAAVNMRALLAYANAVSLSLSLEINDRYSAGQAFIFASLCEPFWLLWQIHVINLMIKSLKFAPVYCQTILWLLCQRFLAVGSLAWTSSFSFVYDVVSDANELCLLLQAASKGPAAHTGIACGYRAAGLDQSLVAAEYWLLLWSAHWLSLTTSLLLFALMMHALP